jgi:ABC-type multidrug transport system ATPase subunit
MAVMGPSGCGKTTFLNCIHQDIPHDGEVLINGSRVTPSIRHTIGFVEQDDIVIPGLTVRQTLLFLAQLRFGIRANEASKRVESLLATLRLGRVADSIIGESGAPVRISGGERKRLCIARELLGEPAMLLCDEPTSGLDSTMADQVIASMRSLATVGSLTILAAIHQPSTSIFAQFDDLLLLKGGEVLYLGVAAEAEALFASCGLRRHPWQSTAEFLMDTLTLEPNVESAEDSETVGEHTGGLTGEAHAQLAKHVSMQALKLPAPEVRKRPGLLRLEPCYNAPFSRQLILLTHRHCALLVKEIFTTLGLIQNVGLMLIAALLWVQLGFTEKDIYPRFGMCMWSAGTWMFFPLFGASGTFGSIRKVLDKELRMGYYSIRTFYVAQTLLPLPVELVFPILWTTGVFWITNVNPDFAVFLQFLLVVCWNYALFQGLGYAVSASGIPPARSATVCNLIITYFFAWSGFFVDLDLVPDWLKWMRYPNAFLYSVQLLMHIIIPDGMEFTCASVGKAGDITKEGIGCMLKEDGTFVINGSEARARFGITTPPWICAMVMLFCLVIFRLVAYALLRYELRTAIHGAQEARRRSGPSSEAPQENRKVNVEEGAPEFHSAP